MSCLSSYGECMSIVYLLIVCVLVGAGLYLLAMAPIDETVKQIIRVVIIVVLLVYVIIFLANLLGVPVGVK